MTSKICYTYIYIWLYMHMWNAFKDPSRWTTALHSSAMVKFAVNFIDLSYLTREHSYITLQYPLLIYQERFSLHVGSANKSPVIQIPWHSRSNPKATHLLQLTQRQTLYAHPIMATSWENDDSPWDFSRILGCTPTAWSFSVSRPRSFQDSWFNPWSKARMVICYL